ncbi:uncharacterized protein LOC111117287 isoform X3 [Crassostrea virginica]
MQFEDTDLNMRCRDILLFGDVPITVYFGDQTCIITPPDFEPASTEPPSKISSKISHVQTTKMPTTKLATRKIPDVQTTKMLTTKLATRKIPDVQTTKMLTTKLATRKIPDVQSTPDIPKIKDDTTASTQTGNDDDDSSVETLMAVLLSKHFIN